MRGLSVLTATLLLATCGCGEQLERPEPVTLDQVPAEVKAAAAKALPGVRFETARKLKVDRQEAYEVRGKDKGGKIREAEVSTAGKVLKIE